VNKKTFLNGVIILAVTIFCTSGANLSSSALATPKTNSSLKTEKTQIKSIQCNNCPCNCLIKPNQTGECGQYKNVDGKLVFVKK